MPGTTGGAMRKVVRRLGLRRRALLALALAALLLPGADTVRLTPARAVALDYVFSVGRWEAANFADKWLHLLWEALPGNKPTREERLAGLDEYLLTARLVQKEEDRLEGRYLRRGTATALGSGGRELPGSREYLDELVETREGLRASAEEATEAEISAVLEQEGLDSRLGLIFPPVDLRFGRPPTILITSPRDRIRVIGSLLLEPDLDVFERDRLEKKLLQEHDLSALVDDLAGLATYPTLVSELHTLRALLLIGAHEWLHAYFFFRPLGRGYWSSQEMVTINETVADLAGREIGDAAFARMGGDLSISASRYLSGEERDPIFTREMRQTRQGVDKLLSEGKVEEAEEYMKARWWFLRLGGYRLRKLNQAYFAFRGRYAEGSASVSPIGDQNKELRSLLPDVGSFVRAVSRVSSPQDLPELIEELKAP